MTRLGAPTCPDPVLSQGPVPAFSRKRRGIRSMGQVGQVGQPFHVVARARACVRACVRTCAHGLYIRFEVVPPVPTPRTPRKTREIAGTGSPLELVPLPVPPVPTHASLVGRLTTKRRRQPSVHELVCEPLGAALDSLAPKRPARLQHVLVTCAPGAAQALDERRRSHPLSDPDRGTRANHEPSPDRVPSWQPRPWREHLRLRRAHAFERALRNGGVERDEQSFELRPTRRAATPAAPTGRKVLLPHGLFRPAHAAATPARTRGSSALTVRAVPHQHPTPETLADLHGAHRSATTRQPTPRPTSDSSGSLARRSAAHGGSRIARGAARHRTRPRQRPCQSSPVPATPPVGFWQNPFKSWVYLGRDLPRISAIYGARARVMASSSGVGGLSDDSE